MKKSNIIRRWASGFCLGICTGYLITHEFLIYPALGVFFLTLSFITDLISKE